jgi:hypothetical protein
MDLIKKILIAIIIIILTYTLWRLIKRRNQIKSKIENFEVPKIIPFTSSPENELDAIKKNSNPVTIKDINIKYAKLPLKEYCIKGSYNSAFTGNYVNLDMISYVLSRGCRYLDFEVFYITENNLTMPKVSVSIDPNYNTLVTQMTPPSNRSILLDNVLSTAVASAFSDTSPNNKDPLFINLRIKSNNPNIYQAVAKSIHGTIVSKLYKGKITDSTKLSDIMGKIVLVIDKTININYLTYAACSEPSDSNCYDLSNYVNLESGSQLMKLAHYSDIESQCNTPITILDDNLNTDVKQLKLLNPDMISNQKSNIYLNPMIYKYGYQIIPYLYSFNDSELSNYEKFFNDNMSAFVRLSIAIPYFQKLSQTRIQPVNL